MKIPLAGGHYTDLPLNSNECQNFYVHIDNKGGKEEISLRGTDGTVVWVDSLVPHGVRAFKVMAGVLYAVIGNSVYSITTAGVLTNLSQPGALQSSFLTTVFDASATTPTGIACKSDGDLLVTDSGTNKIYDITTAGSLNNSYLVTDIDPYATNVTGIAEDYDGDWWITDSNTNKLYKTSNAGVIKAMIGQDVDVATYATDTYDFSTQAASAEGVLFNDNGSTMWVLDVDDLEIYQYTLSTPGEPSSATYATKSMDLSGECTSPQDFCANSDYSKFYVLDSGGQAATIEPKIYQYDLITPEDMATGSYASKSLSVNPQCGGATCIDMNYAGDTVYVGGNLPDFNTKLLLPLNNSVVDFSSDDTPHTVTNNNVTFSTDKVLGSHSGDFNGSTSFLSVPDSNDLYQSSWTIDLRLKLDSQNGAIAGQYASSGSFLFLGITSGKLWCITPSASIVGNTTLSNGTWYHIAIVHVGSTMYFFVNGSLDKTGSIPSLNNISAPFTIGKATYFLLFSTTTFLLTGHIDEFRYSNSARWTSSFTVPTEQYINDSQSLFQYAITTDDISTGNYSDKSLTISEDGLLKSLRISPCGTKGYVLGGDNDTVYQYAMTTAGDLLTGSYDSKSFDVSTQEAAPTGLDFLSTGREMYISGVGDVYQYNVRQRFDSTAADLKGVFVDDDDDLWVLDDTTNKNFKITTAGVLVTSFLTTGFDASATSPTGSGSGWITDTNTNKTYNVDSEGNKLVEFAETAYDAAATDPQDVDISSDGFVWLVDNQTNKVYKLLGSNLTSTSGTIYMETDGTYIVIVDPSDGTGWYVNAAVFLQITDADFPTASSLTYQDSFFLVSEAGTDRMYKSASGDPTDWDALDFASAEGSPDVLVRLKSFNREVWSFGGESLEIFQNTGNPDFPFERIPGSYRLTGLGAADSVAEEANVIFWLGDDRVIYRSEQLQEKAISSPQVAKAIQAYTTISDAKGYAYTKDGHVFYVLNFPTEDKTWVYDLTTNEWHTRTSTLSDTRHIGNCSVIFAGKVLVGSYSSGKILYYDNTAYNDNDVAFNSVRATRYIENYPNRISHSKLELECEAGNSGTVSMDYSDDDGNTWSTAQSKTLGTSYRTRQIWRRLGQARNRIYRFTMSGSHKKNLFGLYLNEQD